MPTCLITGASGGIGSAIAAALAPTHTLLLAGRPSERLDAVAIVSAPPPFRWTWPTPSDRGRCEVVDELDVLVHNAGVASPGRVAESHRRQWRATFEVNVTGAVALTLALLPALRARAARWCSSTPARDVNVSPGMAAYSASKFALRAFADSLRADEPSLRVTSGVSRPRRHRDAA